MNKLVPIFFIIILPDLSIAYGPDQGEAGIPKIAPGKTNLPEPIGILFGLLLFLFLLYYFVSSIRETIKEDPALIITYVVAFFFFLLLD